jgi:hypothetical protein
MQTTEFSKLTALKWKETCSKHKRCIYKRGVPTSSSPMQMKLTKQNIGCISKQYVLYKFRVQ